MMVAMERLARYAWLVLACNVAVVLWGAVVRATGSGAGCGSHWPLCNGEMLPRAPAFETLVEFSHRVTSGMALLLVVGLAVWAFRARPRRHPARLGAALSLLFILSEAGVGAGLVLFDLVAGNKSAARALFMASHLVNTFFLLGALTLTAHWAAGGAPLRLRGRGRLAAILAAGLLGVVLVGVSGAVAALGDTLFPAASLAQALQQDVAPTAHVLVRLRLMHPLLATGVGLGLLFLAWQLGHAFPAAARYARFTSGLVALQVLAGTLNVALLAPIWLQLLHLLLADLLWISLVLLAATALAAAEPAQEIGPLPVGPLDAHSPARWGPSAGDEEG
jgi:heme A synthase